VDRQAGKSRAGLIQHFQERQRSPQITFREFFQNYQGHPHGIEYSTQFVITVLQDVQPKVVSRVLVLSADFGRGKAPPETVTASKSG